jgi:predicted transglutaminase-like cysteine proteinase
MPVSGGGWRRLSVACRLVWVALLCAVGVALSASNYDQLQAHAVQRWGAGITPKFAAWRTLVANLAGAADSERLKRVNDFVNRQTLFGEDEAIWGQQDYWATPLESMGKGAGDCEDFAIFKYFSLREAGVARDKLRLTYVRAKTGSDSSAPTQAHMVLAYYAQPDAEPLVLDNLIGDIRPASRRPDLVPVFSFNSEGVFSGVSGQETKLAAGTGRLSRWEDLLQRVKAEGFE